MRKRNAAVLLGSLMIGGVLFSGCGKKNEASDKKSDKPSVTWMTGLHTTTPPSGDVLEKLEEYTGYDIKFNWIPSSSYGERLNASLASNSLSDIVTLAQINDTTIREAMKSGMFWNVEPYLKDYKNLSQISEARLEAARFNGEIYGVPLQKPIARYGVAVRKDWLENLGLEVPHTIADLEKVIQAFSEDDPDGNGQDDTVGLCDRKEITGFKNLIGFFGAGNQFALEDGKIVPAFMQSEYKETMEWYRNIYKNGWMNSDFAVMAKNDQKNYMIQGKAGVMITGLMDVKNFVAGAKGTEEEGMEWELINDMTYEDVPRRILSDTNGGMGGWMAIPKSVVKTEDDLKKVLKLIDSLIDEEAYLLETQGIEGVHYEIKDGIYEKIDSKKWEQEVQPYNSARPSELVMSFKTSDALADEADEKIRENEEFAITNPAQSLSSDTFDSSWSALSLSIEDTVLKYFMGDATMDDFDAAIENFRQSGGDQIIEELTESYNETH